MRWEFYAIGSPKLGYAREGIEEYLRRIARFLPATCEWVRPRGKETESEALLRRTEGRFRMVLDPGGEALTSEGLARRVGEWMRGGVGTAALLVGGAEGHSRELIAAAGWVWSLGPLTLQHELALLVALEQIYRAHTIVARLPYHR